jgi:release factor glutamine methyltransferase
VNDESSATDIAGVAARLRAAGCVFAEEEAALLVAEGRPPAELDAMVRRRAAGQPLEYVLGWADFCGLRLEVDPGVFVPRHRTQFLAVEAAALAAAAAAGPVVIDLGCGTGALGAVVASTVPGVALHASDIDPVAVRCARRNLARFGAHVTEGDLFDALPPGLEGTVDVLIANAPYVPTDEIRFLPAEARDHEARVALDGGADGLRVLRRVIAAAPTWLAPGGSMLCESTGDQVPALVDALGRVGLTPSVASTDELAATAVIGTRSRS